MRHSTACRSSGQQLPRPARACIHFWSHGPARGRVCVSQRRRPVTGATKGVLGRAQMCYRQPMRARLLCLPLLVACSSTEPATSEGQDAGMDGSADAAGDAVGDATPDAIGDAIGDAVGDAPSADARDTGSPGTLLWFGPHPDDELYLAPLLGTYCVDLGWTCTFVVATRGEGGSCGLPNGCHPDLATVRAAEMQVSADLFGATLDHWDLGDNGQFAPSAGDVQAVLADWSDKEGSVDALLARVTQVIESVNPDVVYAMDWRHGCYCHPSHRAFGAVVAKAIHDMGAGAPTLHLLAGNSSSEPDGWGFRPVAADDPSLEFFDATKELDSVGGEAWLYLIEVLRAHDSQFDLTDAELELIANGPAELKRIYTVRFDAVVEDDPAYENLCPPSTF